MTGVLGPLVFASCIAWLLYRDVKERPSVPGSTWLVLAWVVIYSTRPVTSWLGVDQGPRNDDDGNVVEALISLGLIAGAVSVLVRRKVSLSIAIKENRWLFICYLFWVFSIGWSDYPVITVKRLIKDLGNAAMVLVLLTARDPREAFKAVGARLTYLTIPLSIALIRYYPAIGRTFVGYQGDEVMNIGVATQKNSLGALAMVSALVLLWDLLDLHGRWQSVGGRVALISRGVVLLMCWYVLRIADSATSLICAVLGSAVLIMLAVPAFRRKPAVVESYGIAAAAVLVLVDWAFKLREGFVESLGRDTTLTTRTDVWPVLLGIQDNPLVGAGFATFWAGWRQELVWDRLGVFVQAHNGYLEVYLNGGLVGVGMLVVLLAWGYRRIRGALTSGAREADIRLALLLAGVVHNYAEASFYKLSLMWFMIVFAVAQYAIQEGGEEMPAPQAITGRREWWAAIEARRA